jgi:hypothetical protein
MTLVLTAPPSLVAGFVGIAVGISSGKLNERTWHISVMMGIAAVGFIISATTLNVAARYVSCFLFASGSSIPPPTHSPANINLRCILRQLCDPWLGLWHPWSDAREKGHFIIHGQHGIHG